MRNHQMGGRVVPICWGRAVGGTDGPTVTEGVGRQADGCLLTYLWLMAAASWAWRGHWAWTKPSRWRSRKTRRRIWTILGVAGRRGYGRHRTEHQ
jgi:hypothetical protein